MEIIWKPIKGYEDRYEVSNTGEVRCLKSRVHTYTTPKMMSPEVFSKSKTQYKRVQLSHPRGRFLIHRLVAEAFIPKPLGCNVVNHLDNNGLNNHVSNLEWGTQSSNLKHAQNQGRLTEAQSKGGINRGLLASIEATEKAQKLVGTFIHDWKVLSYIGKTDGKDMLLCECKCGKQNEFYSAILIAKKVRMCKQCAKTEIAYNRYLELKDLSKDTTINNWVFTGNCTAFTGITRDTKYEAYCSICNHITSIPQQSLIGVKPIKNCPVCKDRKAKI